MRKPLRVLQIDTECLPGHWIGGDYVSKVFTAVAWKWLGQDEGGELGNGVEVYTHYETSPAAMALILRETMIDADIVTGHYVRGFDLPLLNGNLLRGGYPPLEPIMTHDTKLDLLKAHGRSLSQENLASQLGLAEPKIKVTLPEWEAFNLKQAGARDKGVERVVQDVVQNEALRKRLIEIGWIGPVKRWDPERSGKGYRP